MRTLTRFLPLALAAAVLTLIAIACGSGGSAGDQTGNSGGSGGDQVSAAPLEVLSASAESFQQDVESLQIEMDFTMNAGGFEVDADADMAFQAPDQLHMTMDITGMGSFEILMDGPDIYMNIPPQGWVSFSMEDMLGGLGLDELGVDSGSFQDAFSEHSFVDYEAIIEDLGGDIEDLGEETVDGETYRHYRGSLDFGDLAATFSDTFAVSEDMNLEDVSGPLTFDIWVAPDTFLPYKLSAVGEFEFGADTMVFDASMRFFGYNEPVDIPAPPEDAASFGELLGDLME